MQIQTFFLAEQITRLSPGRWDVRRAAVCIMECSADTRFPYQLTLPALAVLRRENTDGELPVQLCFELVDEDGRPAGLPRRWLTQSVFADRNRFLYVTGNITFEFPGQGRYRLDITTDDELDESVYHYAIDMIPREKP
jgi:hypothetical protein